MHFLTYTNQPVPIKYEVKNVPEGPLRLGERCVDVDGPGTGERL